MTATAPRTVAAVAAGGIAGSLGRYAVGLVLPHAPGAFPWATLLVNVSGSLAMGLLVAWLVASPGAHPLARPFVGVGVLGGWTTFSALAVDTIRLGATGHEQVALLYVATTFVVGVLAVGAGLAMGARLWPDPLPAEADS